MKKKIGSRGFGCRKWGHALASGEGEGGDDGGDECDAEEEPPNTETFQIPVVHGNTPVVEGTATVAEAVVSHKWIAIS